MSGKSKSQVDNTSRRTWDKDEYAAKAAERLAKEEEEEQLAERPRPPVRTGADGQIVQRAFLKQRDYTVDLESRLGKTQVVTDSTPLNQQAGYYCNVCECIMKDSANFLDHINGKKHQRVLGMSMRVERATLDQVKDRLEMNKRKQLSTGQEGDLDARIDRMSAEEEAKRAEKRERKKQKKAEAEKQLEAEGDVDPEMAAIMGFGGFGGK